MYIKLGYHVKLRSFRFLSEMWRNGAVIPLDQRSSGSLKSWSRDNLVAGREQMYSNAPNNYVVLGLDFNPSLLLNRVVNYKDMFTFHKTFLVSIHGVHCSLLGHS